jgi:hypothetical protein
VQSAASGAATKAYVVVWLTWKVRNSTLAHVINGVADTKSTVPYTTDIGTACDSLMSSHGSYARTSTRPKRKTKRIYSIEIFHRAFHG